MKVTDLEEIFKGWAWEKYLNTNTGFLYRLFHPRLKLKNAVIILNWDNVKFTPLEPKYEELPENKSAIKVVVESEYENETSSDQTHSFKTQRHTVSTATFALTKGYSRSVNVGLEVSLPPEMSDGGHGQNAQNEPRAKRKQMASASFGNSLHLDTEEGNRVEKSLNWGVDTTITSKSDKTTVAKLEVEETSSTYFFTLSVKVKGRIIATIRDARGDGKLIQTIEGDVATVLNDIQRGRSSRVADVKFDLDRRHAFLPVEGTVIFKYGVSQKVKVAYAPGNNNVQRLYPSFNDN